MENLNSILDKIQKLITKSESTDSVEEAASFAAAAQRLMLKYNLDVSKIGKVKHSITEKTLNPEEWGYKRHEGKWLHTLYTQVSLANLCTCFKVVKRDDLDDMLLIGKPENIMIVKFIVDQLKNKLRNLESFAWSVYNGPDKRNAFKRAFLYGATVAIVNKLRAQTTEIINSEPGVAGLVKVNNSEVQAYVDEKIQNQKRSKASGNYSSMEAGQMGYAVGEAIEIQKGINYKEKVEQHMIGG